MTLEESAFYYLFHKRKMRCVLLERGPRVISNGRPDVLGISKDRYMTEIEIKRSMSDFRNNARKSHFIFRNGERTYEPKQFYFLVTPDILDRVKPELPPFAGLLMQCPQHWCKVVVPANVNSNSQKLTIKECCYLFKLQTYQILSLVKSLEHYRNRLTQEGRDYQI